MLKETHTMADRRVNSTPAQHQAELAFDAWYSKKYHPMPQAVGTDDLRRKERTSVLVAEFLAECHGYDEHREYLIEYLGPFLKVPLPN